MKVDVKLHFWNSPTHRCTKFVQRQSFSKKKCFETRQNLFFRGPVFTLQGRILLNTLVQEHHNCNKSFIRVEVSPIIQKVELYLANEGSGLVFFSTDKGHTFGKVVGNEFWVILRGKRHNELEFAYDIVQVQSLSIYTDLINYIIVTETKPTLLHCFPFISKLKPGDIIILTGKYMNYQTISNLQFRQLLKKFFHCIVSDFRDTSGEKIPFVSVGITRFVLMLTKASNIQF